MTQKRQAPKLKYGNLNAKRSSKDFRQKEQLNTTDKNEDQTVLNKESQILDSKTKKITKKERIQNKRKQRIEKLREVKGEIKGQLTAAQSSTKSMGKFDRKAHQEERKSKPKRRKEHSSFNNLSQEVERNLEVFGMVKNSQGSKKVEHSL